MVAAFKAMFQVMRAENSRSSAARPRDKFTARCSTADTPLEHREIMNKMQVVLACFFHVFGAFFS